MILWLLALIASVPLFFAATYVASRARGVRALGAGAVALAALLGVAASVVSLAVPGFFRSGVP